MAGSPCRWRACVGSQLLQPRWPNAAQPLQLKAATSSKRGSCTPARQCTLALLLLLLPLVPASRQEWVPPRQLELLTHPAPGHVYIHTACFTQNPTTDSCACERGCPLPTSSRLLMSGCQKERVPRLTYSLPPPSCTTNLLANLSTPPCLPAFVLANFHHFFITLAVHICPGPHPCLLGPFCACIRDPSALALRYAHFLHSALALLVRTSF